MLYVDMVVPLVVRMLCSHCVCGGAEPLGGRWKDRRSIIRFNLLRINKNFKNNKKEFSYQTSMGIFLIIPGLVPGIPGNRIPGFSICNSIG